MCCDCLILGSHQGHKAVLVKKERRDVLRRCELGSSEENYKPSQGRETKTDKLQAQQSIPPINNSLSAVLVSLCQPSSDTIAINSALRLLPNLVNEVDERLLPTLLTFQPGSLLTALRHVLTSHLDQPSPSSKSQLTSLLTFSAGVLKDPSLSTRLAVFRVGAALADKGSARGLSLMEDLGSLCNSKDPCILSSALQCLAALVSKRSCLVLVSSHLPCLVEQLTSPDPLTSSASLKIVHCIATTDASREAVTQSGASVRLLLPHLSNLLHSHCTSFHLSPMSVSHALGSLRSLLFLLNPGDLPPPLLAQIAAALSSIRGLGEGHERLIESIAGQRLMLEENRNIRQFQTSNTRGRIRELERDFLQKCIKPGNVVAEFMQNVKASSEDPHTIEKHSSNDWFGAESSDDGTADEEPGSAAIGATGESEEEKQTSANILLCTSREHRSQFQGPLVEACNLTSRPASSESPAGGVESVEIPCRSVWDSHCHLDFLLKRFAKEEGFFAGDVLTKSLESDGQALGDKFGGCIANFCDPWDWTQGALGDQISSLIRACSNEQRIFITLGCHPHFADKLDDAALDQLRMLAGRSDLGIVAIGECGLDTSPKNKVPLKVQLEAFGAQVDLALSFNLPIVLHIRGAEEEAFRLLETKKVPPDWPMHYHCFSGTLEMAEQWLGDYPASKIGLTGLVTYPDAVQVHEVARHLPLEKIVLETDSPYFLPYTVNKRSYPYSFSQPGHVLQVATEVNIFVKVIHSLKQYFKVAELRGVSLLKVLGANRKNIHELYCIKLDVGLNLQKNNVERTRSSVVTLEENGEKEPGVPSWLGGDHSSSDDSSESEAPDDSIFQGMDLESWKVKKRNSNVQRSVTDTLICPTSNRSWTSLGRNPVAPEAVVKGEYLSLRQGPHVELLGIDKFRDLLKSYNQLAIAICSFLNGRDGGEVYIGVRRSGEVVGVALTRKQRDDLRQVVDRVLAQMIVPPIPTILVEGRPLVVINCKLPLPFT